MLREAFCLSKDPQHKYCRHSRCGSAGMKLHSMHAVKLAENEKLGLWQVQ